MRHIHAVPGRLRSLGLLVLAVAACGDPTSIGAGLGDFLIRQPTDSPIAGAPSLTVSATATDTVHFQWEPSDGADRYSIIFERVATQEQMDTLGSNLESVTFSIPVDHSEITLIPLGPEPEEGEQDDRPLLRVVAHDVAYSELDALLSAEGLPTGEPLYFLWSVVAHSGSRSLRSIEIHRLTITRN